jgi:hypothetical protein
MKEIYLKHIVPLAGWFSIIGALLIILLETPILELATLIIQLVCLIISIHGAKHGGTNPIAYLSN